MPCSYCEAHSHLITCADCHQTFCNTFKGTTISHIIFHLKKNAHKRIMIDRPVVCELCGESNVFVLRRMDGMVCCGSCGMIGVMMERWLLMGRL
ncbi:RNA helicase nonsense mRNA reducing factor (pNORF1) [Trachipleistophora hominis]|uniref:RNA helicase nonsense mRNA reducing factor (PNORF1) n=1 Tax=Trachipleistophora hominis TaxID=72359 RepID=L7JUF2_TRAHO|nr:RNA helicase nonsense mRNA reducing factor (pNORF1) [Trachipleistophora hominis]